ncbi:hypothetical protein RHSIM_Rhsim07G0133900 [Rhododendron simsii]|uniref:Amidase domain-containing protein n=1 Tax=Rhododendron simsii TaxID=118357 RepID=A0A834GQ76_RHOSS|nr:hypothetical protein RHSIM_Rhsim07G0133900 [Rhododendron simsii]
MPTTIGSRVREGYRPPLDATAVRKLRESGAIIFGKPNLADFGIESRVLLMVLHTRMGTEFEHHSSSPGLEIFTKSESPMELESGNFLGGNAKSGHPIVMRFFIVGIAIMKQRTHTRHRSWT